LHCADDENKPKQKANKKGKKENVYAATGSDNSFAGLRHFAEVCLLARSTAPGGL